MSNKKTTIVIAGLAATALLLAGCSGGDDKPSSGGSEKGSSAGGEGKVMRLALNQTEEHPSFIALDHFNDYLKENTNGWGIDVFPNETLGAQAEALQLVSDGSVDMAIVSGPQLENLNPDFTVFNLPKVFDGVEHQMQVINDSDIPNDLYTSLEADQKITVLGGYTQGARSIYTSFGPVKTPADLSGKKLRVQESKLNIAMAEALGAAATPMAYGELYTGLQSGVVDAAENNEVSYFTQKHFEVAPYWSSTKHLVGLDYLIINTDVLNGMSDEDRAAFDEGWRKSWEEHTELWEQATKEAKEGAEAGGATFTDVDDAAFTEALSKLADEFITNDTQQALYDAARDAVK